MASKFRRRRKSGTASEAEKYLDSIRAGYQGEIQAAQINEQTQEALLARDLAQHKITKQQEIAAVRDARLKELAEETCRCEYDKLGRPYAFGCFAFGNP